MTIQAKRLRDYCRAQGLLDSNGKTPRVRTRRFHRCHEGQRFTEWGSAEATIQLPHTFADRVVAECRRDMPYATIQTVKLAAYTILFIN